MKNFHKPKFFLALFVLIAGAGSTALASHVDALDLASLQAQLSQAIAAIDQLQSQYSDGGDYNGYASIGIACPDPSVVSDLKIGMRDPMVSRQPIVREGEIKSLQAFLWQYQKNNSTWGFPKNREDFVVGIYGGRTMQVVKNFQRQFGVVTASPPSRDREYGRVYQKTRDAILKECAPSSTPTPTPSPVSVPGGYAVSVESVLPVNTEQWTYGGSNGVTLNVFKFIATGESMALTDLRLQLDTSGSSTGADFRAVELWDGPTLLQRKVAPTFIGGLEDFQFPQSGAGSFVIPQDSSRLMTIKADLAQICLGCSGTAGQLVGTDYDGAVAKGPISVARQRAVGLTSGMSVHSSTHNDQNGNGVVYFRSVPSVRKYILSDVAISGEQALYRFAVKAVGGDIKLNRVTFGIATSGVTAMGTQLPSFRLFSVTNNNFVTYATGAISSYFYDKKNYDEQGRLLVRAEAGSVNYTYGEYKIPNGQEHVFELRGTITDDATAGGYVLTTLLGDNGQPSIIKLVGSDKKLMARVQDIIPSVNEGRNHLIWSDLSSEAKNAAVTNSISTDDWMNGYHVPGLPVIGLDPQIKSVDGGVAVGLPAPTGAVATRYPYGVLWSESFRYYNAHIELNWIDQSSTETNFIIERATSTSPIGFLIDGYATSTFGGGSFRTYRDRHTMPDTTYEYRVRAENTSVWPSTYSPYSNVTLAAVMSPASPSNPILQSRGPLFVYPYDHFELNWTDASTDEQLFLVEISTSTPDAFVLIDKATSTPGVGSFRTFRDRHVQPGLTYYYRVRAWGGRTGAYFHQYDLYSSSPLVSGILSSSGTASLQSQTLQQKPLTTTVTTQSTLSPSPSPSPTDTTPPKISILAPSSTGSYTTNKNTVTIGAIITDKPGTGVATSTARWANSATGDSGPVNPTIYGWIAYTSSGSAAIPLNPGSNQIKITASDNFGNSSSVSITVIYNVPLPTPTPLPTPSPTDATPPKISILAPSSTGSYTTNKNTVTIGAIITDKPGTGVATSTARWANSATGDSGPVNPTIYGWIAYTSSGSAAIPLKAGANIITYSVKDNTESGNPASASITVTYNAPVSSSGSVLDSLASIIDSLGAVIASLGTSGTVTIPPPVPPQTENPPVIDGISGPQTLLERKPGHWAVRAHSRPEGNPLGYAVNWGDEGTSPSQPLAASRESQTATFSHSYLKSGTYTAVFTVTDQYSGLSEQASMDVVVKSPVMEGQRLSIEPQSIRLAVGKTATVRATLDKKVCSGPASDNNCTVIRQPVDVEWSSSDGSIATVKKSYCPPETAVPPLPADSPCASGYQSYGIVLGIEKGKTVINALYRSGTRVFTAKVDVKVKREKLAPTPSPTPTPLAQNKGRIRIKRVGADELYTSAPATTAIVSIKESGDILGQSMRNPYVVHHLKARSYRVSVKTKIDKFDVEAGLCRRPVRTGDEDETVEPCVIDGALDYPIVCQENACFADIDVASNEFVKIVFKYAAKSVLQIGTIRVKRVGSSETISDAPDAVVSVVRDDVVRDDGVSGVTRNSKSNPASFQLPPSPPAYIVSTTNNALYKISAGYCQRARGSTESAEDCTVTEFDKELHCSNARCQLYDVPVQSKYITKVVFKYVAL